MKLYIYLLYEIFILESTYIINTLGIIYGLSSIMLNYTFVAKATYGEVIMFLIIMLLFLFVIITALLWPFLLYIPGDCSRIEKILSESKLPHARYLIEYKRNIFKKH